MCMCMMLGFRTNLFRKGHSDNKFRKSFLQLMFYLNPTFCSRMKVCISLSTSSFSRSFSLYPSLFYVCVCYIIKRYTDFAHRKPTPRKKHNAITTCSNAKTSSFLFMPKFCKNAQENRGTAREKCLKKKKRFA